MMAHDKTPDRPQLSASSVDALQNALNGYLASGTTDALQPTLQRIAAEARDRRMHAEQLLVTLKDVWFALPQVMRAPGSEDQNKLLQRVVSLCIREYYNTAPNR
jgi:hypothetical protein